ncbi:MAG TPA: HAD-IA family hydrolase [Trebonia sp.]|jgi:HAD superfamily hydrolase (TIGR01662 family)|nr:HAD-IA family hydrolase [Trebonia sp.]
MTTPGTDAASLGTIIARTRWLLLDFDGPICSIYAGLRDAVVADKLRKLIPGELPAGVASTQDPIEVFCYSGTVSQDLAARVEAEMTDLEVAAVASAEPTPYVHEVIASARESGRTVGVVSNNSFRAVNTYLDRHGLSEGIALVVARTSYDPALLKPNPHLIHEAIQGLKASRAGSALVGDSYTDIEAARTAGVASIGYANKPGKRERMAQLQAGAVIDSMAELALLLRAHRISPEV